jgi:hypothetical protein
MVVNISEKKNGKNDIFVTFGKGRSENSKSEYQNEKEIREKENP